MTSIKVEPEEPSVWEEKNTNSDEINIPSMDMTGGSVLVKIEPVSFNLDERNEKEVKQEEANDVLQEIGSDSVIWQVTVHDDGDEVLTEEAEDINAVVFKIEDTDLNKEQGGNISPPLQSEDHQEQLSYNISMSLAEDVLSGSTSPCKTSMELMANRDHLYKLHRIPQQVEGFKNELHRQKSCILSNGLLQNGNIFPIISVENQCHSSENSVQESNADKKTIHEKSSKYCISPV